MAAIIRRYPLPVVFVTALFVVTSVYAYALGPSGQRSVVAATATNIANLERDPLGTLVASAFVAENALGVWVVLAVVGLFPLVRRFGNPRALLLVASAHVAGTLLSEGVLAWRISAGAEPASMRFLDDVGPSYVVASALLVTVVFGGAGRWWRALAALGLAALAPSLFSGLGRLDVAAVGHVVAMTTGIALAWGLAGFGTATVRRALASVRQLHRCTPD